MQDPKENSDKTPTQGVSDEPADTGSEAEKPSYYYDDSHGYEDFEPEHDEEAAE